MIMSLHIRGDSRIALGDARNEDLEEALRRAEALGAVSEIVTSYSYLADREWQVEGPAVALARLDEGTALADRRGAYSQGTWSKVSALQLSTSSDGGTRCCRGPRRSPPTAGWITR